MIYALFCVGEKNAVVSNIESRNKSSAIVIKVKFNFGIQNKQAI